MAHKVILAIGTNINHHENMRHAKKMLGDILDNEICSDFLWTDPIGMDSGKFLNAVIRAETELDIHELENELKNIEQTCGRKREESMRMIIKMDIDILAYDNMKMHIDDWNREYIRKLMGETDIHP
ncbi:2-amino-4-hydroxy-6-hydroxymethyldihydropteridine diphosphokinase [Xylanibacter muris]|uniref:2-amino-4-hydroxy-6-hydroxymethyldihydropteridine pyrophosphokinase n=1 Tax=Xylanibacter muris TaxID=2736290 RepID=A0ABX2APG7_9BACT|nr:2-amino-4-hydroxy-6-hydroxymethyldihydropteridine diphosphokinase [Xylanibacter muris]NPD93141.1 2-amino-4-hydroxy-6-hydroxymethyldihydropteridine diphosphokinase [Xylanibacter muris]